MTASTAVQADHRELLLQAYAAHNSQDIAALLALVSDDVNRHDDDVGRLHGKDEARAYRRSNGPHAHPRRAGGPRKRNDGRTAVHISQVLRSPHGSVIPRASFCTYTAWRAIASRAWTSRSPAL